MGPAADPPRARGALLAVSIATPIVAVLSGLGAASPAALALTGVASLGVLVTLARERVLRGPAPRAQEVALAGGLGLSLAAAVFLASYGASLTGDLLLRRIGGGWAAIAGALAAVLLRGSIPEGVRRRGEALLGGAETGGAAAPSTPPRHRLSFAAIPLGVVIHAFFFFSYPPLIEGDSYVNLMEPPFFYETTSFFHHPPVYVLIVKALGEGPRFLVGLQVLALLQHALVVFFLAFVVERVVRAETGSPRAGALAAIFIASDPHLALYSQLILTEIVAISFWIGSMALLVEAGRRPRADRWLVAAGVSAGLATLTRQAFEFWPFVVAAWILATGVLRPRRRAAIVFMAAAYAPLLPVVLHNQVFFARAALTAATGRNLIYRVCEGLPDLTDPKAAPGDELERARSIVWANRTNLWKGAYDAVRADLDWSDARVDAAVQRFYFEQATKYPVAFGRVTLAYMSELLVMTEPITEILQVHDLTVPHAPEPWDRIPAVSGSAPAWLERVTAVEPTSRLLVLVFAAAAPLLARGGGRRLALLAIASAGYLLLLTAMVEVPVFRYRLPIEPLVLFAVAVGATGARGPLTRGAERGRTVRRAALAAALAAAPGLLGAAIGTAHLSGLALALAAVLAVAILVARGAAGDAPPGGLRAYVDLGAWWAAAATLAATVLLSSPAPEILSTPTPGRRLALAASALVAAASVGVILARPRAASSP